MHAWRLNLQESGLSFHYLGSRDQTQASRFNSKHLRQLSHFSGLFWEQVVEMRSQGKVENQFSLVISLVCFSGGMEFLFHKNNWEFETLWEQGLGLTYHRARECLKSNKHSIRAESTHLFCSHLWLKVESVSGRTIEEMFSDQLPQLPRQQHKTHSKQAFGLL